MLVILKIIQSKSGIQYYYTVRQCVEYDKVYKDFYDKNGIKAPIIPQKKTLYRVYKNRNKC